MPENAMPESAVADTPAALPKKLRRETVPISKTLFHLPCKPQRNDSTQPRASATALIVITRERFKMLH
jgi:hypothetical protein